MWAIVKVVTFTLNHVVLACVMNQFKGDWLLLDALTTHITFIMNMDLNSSSFLVGLKSGTFLGLKSYVCM
jgi:hypothetical protein